MELREQADLLLSYHDGDDRCGCLRVIVTGLLNDDITLFRLVDVLSTCLSEHPAGTAMRRDFGRDFSTWVPSLQRPLQRDDSDQHSERSSDEPQRTHQRTHGRTDVRTNEELTQLGSEHDTKQRARKIAPEPHQTQRVVCDICNESHTGYAAENTRWGLDHAHRNNHRSFTSAPTTTRPGA